MAGVDCTPAYARQWIACAIEMMCKISSKGTAKVGITLNGSIVIASVVTP